MVRLGINPVAVLALALTAAAQLAAQQRPVPAAVVPRPFSMQGSASRTAPSVSFVPAEKMSRADRLLAADADSSIAEHALRNGFDFEQGTWSYQQIVCPALPRHLFLQYTRNNGVGDVTVFSVAITRNGEGRLRMIPILRRSYSLFSPAPINALTISAFNHIRAEENATESSDWLGNALCYAALAGAHPRVEPADAEPHKGRPIPAVTPVLVVPAKGGEAIRFVDAAATPRPMQWTMTFNRKGKLVKASHKPAPLYKAEPVSHKPAAHKTWTVPADQNR